MTYQKDFLNTIDYDVEWIEERNKGRLILLETSNEIHYINLSQTGDVRGRNYQVQSIPTALSIYLSESKYQKEENLILVLFFCHLMEIMKLIICYSFIE